MLDSAMDQHDQSRFEDGFPRNRSPRQSRRSEGPFTFWLTGFSGAGKSTLARAFARDLEQLAIPGHVLDGDEMRTGLCSDLGFCEADRTENNRRIAEAARLINDAGVHAIVAVISPMRAQRDAARRIIGTDRFLEIHVDTPLATCIERDPKGLYARARSGELAQFTGISAVYETPIAPDLVVRTDDQSIAECNQLLKWFAFSAMSRQSPSASLSA